MTVQNIQSGYGNATVNYARKAISTEEKYRQIFEENAVEINRIWSDQELAQGYLNN